VDVAVGTPATIPRVDATAIVDWVRAADEGPYSSLGIIDRVAYGNHEPLTALAAFAGATERIRLMTTVLVVPIRNTGLLAKQAATVDSLSGGRLTLGVGIGGREEDYTAAGSGTDFRRRAAHLEEQLTTMRRIWAGEPPREDVGQIGPRPVQEGGPPILIGGYSEPAARRAGRMGDGFLGGNLPPAHARELYEVAVAARTEAGGDASDLRFVACAYWTLGDEATLERGRDYLRDYYGFREGAAERAAGAMLDSEDAVRARLDEAAAAGIDEYVLWPAVADPDQLDRLAALLD
jgi:alkanesulfonate monooxygenase SsuD/methylene tetrahydromethanopterin reductase-like flavin-dependent oxidoreductase (luciferase family)